MSIAEVVLKTYRPTLLVLAFAIALFVSTSCSKYGNVRKALFPQYLKCDAIRVIDGDTFYCQFQTDREIEKIKLIGIEIPELLGERATEFTKSYLRRGIPVKLERDAEGRDSHGRVLAYIYIPGDEMLNALLIQEGYARVMTVQPNFKYKDLFLNLQKQAKEQGKGLWGK
jgi:micrococcal nuclease